MGVWQRSSPLGKVAPLVKSNYRLTDDFSAALLPLNSLKPKEGSTHLPRAGGGLTKSGALPSQGIKWLDIIRLRFKIP